MKFPYSICSFSLSFLCISIENNKNGGESGFSSDDQLLSSDEESSSFTSDSTVMSSNSVNDMMCRNRAGDEKKKPEVGCSTNIVKFEPASHSQMMTCLAWTISVKN